MTSPGPAARRLLVTVSGRVVPAAARGLAGWLQDAAPARARGAVDIALVGDVRMRGLNREYRGIDRVTDVLSFPADAPRHRIEGEARPLGDIAIALGRAARQASRQGHALRVELRVLALHGLLHLLGYDHERDQGQMRRAEERLRRRAGLPSGLIGRPPDPGRP